MPQARTRVVIWEDATGKRGGVGPMDERTAARVRDEVEERGLKIHDEIDVAEPYAWLVDDPEGEAAVIAAQEATLAWNTPAELTPPTGPSILDAFKVLGERQVCDNRLTFATPGSREASDAYANERQRRRSR